MNRAWQKYPDGGAALPVRGTSRGRLPSDPEAVVTAVFFGLIVWLAAAAAFLMLHGRRLRVVQDKRDGGTGPTRRSGPEMTR